MIVIQELYSKSGNFRQKELEVHKISKMDNVLLSFTKHSHVIWINDKQYPIIFRSASLRDNVYNELKAAIDSKIDITNIPLEHFYLNRFDEEKLKGLVKNYSINKYLFGVCQQLMIMNRVSFNDLRILDAFGDLSSNQFKNIQNKTKQTFTDEQISIFSRTLRYPKRFHDIATPHTFWSTIAEL